MREKRPAGAEHGVARGQSNAGGGVGHAAAGIGFTAFRVRADHAERAARGELLVCGTRGKHHHVARPGSDLNAAFAAELDRDRALVDAQNFVAVAVMVMKREYAVPPSGRPAVSSEKLFERLRRRPRHGARVDEERPCHALQWMRDHSAAATASPKARVPSRPPRSAVRVSAFASTLSTAASIAFPAFNAASSFFRSPIHSSSIAAERMSDVGLARSFPAM